MYHIQATQWAIKFFLLCCISSEQKILLGICTVRPWIMGAKENTDHVICSPTQFPFDLKAKPRSCIVLYMVAFIINVFVSKDGENALLLIVTF